MPTLDGVRFHDYVREFSDFQDIPFIFMSGYDDEQTHNLVVDPTIDFFSEQNNTDREGSLLIETLKTSKEAKSK